MKLEDGYTLVDGYTEYKEYIDGEEEIYEVSVKDRTIPDVTQVVMKGDTNSQYILYQLPRYVDGIDLAEKTIIVRWYNESNYADGGSYSDVCDVRYNDEYLRLAWLLPYSVTVESGKICYCFMATGTNEVDDNYSWKTALGKLTVTDNLDNGAASDEVEDDWFTTLMNNVSKLYSAADKASSAAASAEEATQTTIAAIDAANEAAEAAKTATEDANEATEAAKSATEDANEATEAANNAADSANLAVDAIYTDKNFLLLLNDDGTLSLTYNDEEE